MAEIKTYAEQCPVGGGVIHLGATSMDIEDNADALRIRTALDLILVKLAELLKHFSNQIETYADLTVMAHTHIQPAEPTTLGYRLAQYTQDLFNDYQDLQRVRKAMRGKGFKGAVGSSASYAELLGAENLTQFEKLLSEKLDLPFFPITTQTYPRKQDSQVINALAGLGGSLYKFAFDLRILQSPPFGELSEPFGKHQVGSSAMPFKRNPINAEKIDSLGRALAQMPRLAWDNAAHSLLERTLDDSANRRTMLPEAFLSCDELLRVSLRIISDLRVNQAAIQRNLNTYGPFAATERVLMAAAKQGADRQELHELIRQHALAAWETINQNQPNPLAQRLSEDQTLLAYLSPDEIQSLMDASEYVGMAPQRARALAAEIRAQIN
jgi:adenylosuccinate lyase